MSLPSIDIVIVNWNAGEQLRECLESITAADHGNCELKRVIVIDNASSDASAERLNFQNIPLTVIRNGENRGFAAACNQGARASTSDFVLFLNPDTRLFADSLSKCVHIFRRNENSSVGIIGPRLVDELGKTARTCARFPTLRMFVGNAFKLNLLLPRAFPEHFMLEWDHLCSREVDQVIGAFFLVRRKVFEELGGFDERFFVYFEEVDFSFRAFQAGWKTLYCAEATAFHKGGGCSEQVKARRLFYSLQSRILYGFKHLNSWQSTPLLLLTAMAEPISRVGAAAMRFSANVIVETLHAYALFYRALPHILRTVYGNGKTGELVRSASMSGPA